MNIKKLLAYLISWRLIITLVALAAVFIIPLRPGYTTQTNNFSPQDLLSMWANFDGQHYLNIAQYGYNTPQTGYLQAFFPLYPLTIRYVATVIPNYLLSALFISHLSLVLALFFLYKLIRFDYSKSIAQTTILLLLIAPPAFYFASAYTESIFLLLSVLAFYTARRKNWLLSSIFISLASGTRLTGIFLLPAIAYEFFLAHNKDLKKTLTDPHLIWFFLAPIGLLAYMRFLFNTVHDALFFVHVQPLFGAQREVGRFILLYQVFYRYAKMIVFVNHSDPLFFTVVFELLTGLLFLFLSVYSFFKMRLSYAFYLAASYLLPTLTGTFSSLPRYVLVLFPGFIMLSQFFLQQKKLTRRLFVIASIIIAVFSISLFTRGYFVG